VEPIIDKLLNRYESGTVSRRQLIQGLAMLATAGTAKTASAQGFEVVGFDHIQTNSANALVTAEWYRRVLGLQRIRAGAMEDDSEEIAHVGTPGNLLLSIRKLEPAGKVDHIGFRVTGASGEALTEELTDRGGVFHPPDPDAAPGSYLHDPDGIRLQVGPKVTTQPY
jgi:catechol 2,3-dioxygenase-like lactoylglutathione lyase family enzyme